MLKPSDMKELPQEFRTALEQEGCRIPLTYNGESSSGWTKGSFAKRGQTDWAVLCSSKSGQSEVRIFWGGTQKPCPTSFASTPNKTYLQVVDKNKVGFS
ncbi:MAG: hypothetical protein AB7O96_11810, partial [Pseudobdellovibrionaceae bacterium]